MFNIIRYNVLTHFRIARHFLQGKQIAKFNCVSYTTNKKLFQESKKSHDSNSWTPVYFFPYIRIAAVCSRLKLYQTAFTLAAVPWSFYVYNDGLIEASSVAVITGCAISACCTLYIISYFFRRLIGIIFLSDDEESVQISHLTFWGHKKDIIVPLQDLVPLAESACKPTDIYIKLKRYSCEDELYFSLSFGKVLDKIKFEKVFGSLETFPGKN